MRVEYSHLSRSKGLVLKHGAKIVTLVYAILFVLISLFVFRANDDDQPIGEIFQWQYLIPVAMYSGLTLWFSFGFFLVLKKKLSIEISLLVAVVIGIPVGLRLVFEFARLVFQ